MTGDDDPRVREKREIASSLRQLNNSSIDERRNALNRLEAIKVRTGTDESTTWLRRQCDLVAARKCARARVNWNDLASGLNEHDIGSQVYADFRGRVENATKKKHLKFCDDENPFPRFYGYLGEMVRHSIIAWFKQVHGSSPPYLIGVAANTLDEAVMILRDGGDHIQRTGQRPDWMPDRDGLPTDIRELQGVIDRLVSESDDVSTPPDVLVLPSDLRALVRAAVEEAQARRRAGRMEQT